MSSGKLCYSVVTARSGCKCSLVMLGDCQALSTCSGDTGFVFSTNYYFSRTRKTASSFVTSDLSTPGTRQAPSILHVTIISGVTNTQQSSTCLTRFALRPERSWGAPHCPGQHNNPFLTEHYIPAKQRQSFLPPLLGMFPTDLCGLPCPVDPVATRSQGPLFHSRLTAQTHSHTSQSTGPRVPLLHGHCGRHLGVLPSPQTSKAALVNQVTASDSEQQRPRADVHPEGQ